MRRLPDGYSLTWHLVVSYLIGVDEQKQMLQDVYRYPTRLTATVARLPLEDSLDVYAAAANVEKESIAA
jgi:hypothetical protein